MGDFGDAQLDYSLFAGFDLLLNSEVRASCSFMKGHFWTAINQNPILDAVVCLA